MAGAAEARVKVALCPTTPSARMAERRMSGERFRVMARGGDSVRQQIGFASDLANSWGLSRAQAKQKKRPVSRSLFGAAGLDRGLGAEEQVLEAVEWGVGVLYLGEEVVHLLDGVFGLVRARGRGRDAPGTGRRDARPTARRRDARATAVADGLKGGGDVADVAPGEGFDAEIEEAVEFVERDAELEGDPGGGQASAAGLLPNGTAGG